jgi:tRNA-specific 2-thiouridylase
VLDVQPAQNRVVVGPAELLTVDTITGGAPVWFDGTDTSGAWFDAEVQVRAHGEPVAARVRAVGDVVEARLTGERLRGVAPGQSLVVYDGTRVLGQATVQAASRSGAARAAAALA